MGTRFPHQNSIKNGRSSSTREGNNFRRPEGTTEHDAVHQRFLEQETPSERVVCLSCGTDFPKQTIADVIRHYADQVHAQFYTSCLYCQGKIHRYRDGKGTLQLYHDCYRSTNKLDQ
ncbi:uncharacterized protein LOC128739759 [Sabethes cyaneus]|uniref:uncharacterized protein LOC128739759 n=1 Tax=Sabethes cyaneus TaxID=53552 RepID=UPI00237D8048|nr:uncharacterized protein LOC128739759 [Sabethes cyaneus]